jgi:hypothetical protein
MVAVEVPGTIDIGHGLGGDAGDGDHPQPGECPPWGPLPRGERPLEWLEAP